jgi:membrane fusion protein, multidrug efflux system
MHLVIVVLAGCARTGDSEDFPPRLTQTQPIVDVTISEVVRRDLARTVVVPGTVEPFRRVHVATRIQGVVRELLVEEGTRVREGQVLARIDVREEEAQLRRARAALENMERHFERIAYLRETETVAEAEVETARSDLDMARSEADLWETRVAFAAIVAPFDGVVTAKHVEVGSGVAANQRVIDIDEVATLVVRAGLSELDIVHLQTGDQVDLRLDAFPGLQVEGVIRRIFPGADREQRLFTVEVLLRPPTNLHLRPGYLARLHFSFDRREARHVVPSTAVSAGAGASHLFVVDQEEGTVSRRTVTTGLEQDGWTEIISGVEAGEYVVVGPSSGLAHGAPVRAAIAQDEIR